MSSPAVKLKRAGLCLFLCLSACRGSDDPGERGARPPSGAGPRPGSAAELPPLVLTPVAPETLPAAKAAPSPRPLDGRRTAPPAPGPPAAVAVPPTPATAGTFLFTEAGLTRIRGCLTLDQPPPSPTKLVAGPPSGAGQHLERDQRDPLGSGSTASIDVEYRPDGIYLTNLRQTQTSLLSSQPTDFQPSPPVLLLPAAPTAGQTWSLSLTSKDGAVKIDSQNRVEALGEPVTLGNGKVVQTRRVVADSRITGQSSQGTLDLTRKMTTWYAPENGLPAKEVTDMKGRVGLCEIDSHIEAVLQSL